MSTPSHQLFALFSFIITIAYAQPYTTIKHHTLNPITKTVGATKILTNYQEVSVVNDEWIVTTRSESGWSFMIMIDPEFGFHESYSSAISVTINTNQPNFFPGDELLFGITSTNTEYISFKIPLSSTTQSSNQIYPACNPSPTSTLLFAGGDIAALPKTNRDCEIAGGSCNNWRNMSPRNVGIMTSSPPIKFEFQNHPATNSFSVYFTSNSAHGFQIQQTCYFGNNFLTNNGLKIFISGSNAYTISSFDIASSVKFPTQLPTINPTDHPTENPTQLPTKKPTRIPTENPTINPTDHPTEIPTQLPTITPTKLPTVNPTSPTNNPTISPTNKPTPAGYRYGAYDQLCEYRPGNQLCMYNTQILSAQGGRILCLESYDCCMCKSIQCGLTSAPCNEFAVGRAGIYGVKDVMIIGNPNGMVGADIYCGYPEACAFAVIDASNVNYLKCTDAYSCQNAMIIIADPKPNFVLECTGPASCEGLTIYIDLLEPAGGCGTHNGAGILELSKIKCGQDGCNGMSITINNEGCDVVRIVDLECIETNSCTGAVFNLIGDVFIDNCQCGKSCETAVGLDQCFENLEKVQCSDPLECQNQIKTITNPANGFEFVCSDMQSCENGRFVIELNSNMRRQVTNFNHIVMSGSYSGRYATIVIENKQGTIVSINNFECSGLGACNGLQLITGWDVAIDKVICGSNACVGCVIRQTIDSPPIPCDPNQLQI